MFLDKIKKNYKQIKRRWRWRLYRKKQILNKDALKYIKDRIKTEGTIKLNIGCGEKNYPDYINIDAVPLEGTDIVMNLPEDLCLIPSETVSEVLLESVLEHFYRYEQDDLLKECCRILVKGGELVIKTLPDFDGLIDAYLNKKQGDVSEVFDLYEVYRNTHGDPQLHNSPHQLHKDIFNQESVRELINRTGFDIKEMSRGGDSAKDLETCFLVIAVKR